jgi:hypothetical protein
VIPAAWLHAAARIAIVVWGMPHCGHVHQRVAQAIPAGDPATTAAWAIPWRCEIDYYGRDRNPWVWWRVCAATVHEWGHLTGHGHSRNPASPMYPVLHPIPQCARAPG